MCAKSSNFAADFNPLKKEVGMRKIIKIGYWLLLIGYLTFAHTLTVQAGEYAYLVFTNTEGSKTAFSVVDLTMTINGAQLEVTNAEGSVNFTLTDLANMEFSATNPTTALENVLDGDQPVQVYSISGMVLGTFSSLVQAVQQLDRGTYIMVQSGKSQKLVVK